MKNLSGGINNQIYDLQLEINQINQKQNNSNNIINKNSQISNVLNLSFNNNLWQIGVTNTKNSFYIDKYNDDKSTFFINNNKYIGIGTNNPTCKLDIIGDVKINGNLNTQGDQIINNSLINNNQTIGSNLNIIGQLICQNNVNLSNIYISNKINNILKIIESPDTKSSSLLLYNASNYYGELIMNNIDSDNNPNALILNNNNGNICNNDNND